MSLAFPRKSTTLDDLPNEILFEIISYFPKQREIHRRLRIAHVLSLVNRRLRSFAEPITLQHIYFSEFYKYYSWISEVRCGRYRDKLHFIQSVIPLGYFRITRLRQAYRFFGLALFV
ncbi:hypothetical protein C8Q75DRAFT_341406 [Abortiporus biennis]|nr:hypothetical protein C8Q75DRAFT_341406 [Abortiporus biennis]